MHRAVRRQLTITQSFVAVFWFEILTDFASVFVHTTPHVMIFVAVIYIIHYQDNAC